MGFKKKLSSSAPHLARSIAITFSVNDTFAGIRRGLVGGSREARQRGRIGSGALVKAIYRPFLFLCLTYAYRYASSASAAQMRVQKCTRRSKLHTDLHTRDDAIYTAMCRGQKFIRAANKTSNNIRGTSNICSLARTSVKLRGAVKKIITFLFAQYH